MRSVKRISLIFLMTFSFGFAQENPNPEAIAEYQDKVMTEDLNLDQDQQEKVSVINLKYAEKIVAIRNRPGGKFGKIGDIRDTQKAKAKELEKVLSPEQFELFEDEVAPKLKQQMREKMKQ
ncbi:hypothetical protein [Poritiphilus flavus]|uniref:Uncharacterized protein n=1 Tax=Poritiphilus flavus TaxID=2697053 RepID=A0A6L9EB14_9FLAO|nr:hypothetical protein [Poritiphilus flavus]NAS11947.1 hypothetical protein [Poritiphilus flavus]